MFAPTEAAAAVPFAKRVLLLEDDKMLVRLLSKFLSEQGYFVLATDNVREAWDLVRKEEWDLVITDGALHSDSGEDFAGQVAGKFENLPLILITGSVCAVKNEGVFSSVLRKPFRREVFLEAVGRMTAQVSQIGPPVRPGTGGVN